MLGMIRVFNKHLLHIQLQNLWKDYRLIYTEKGEHCRPHGYLSRVWLQSRFLTSLCEFQLQGGFHPLTYIFIRTDKNGTLCLTGLYQHGLCWTQTEFRLNICFPYGCMESGFMPGRGCLTYQPLTKSLGRISNELSWLAACHLYYNNLFGGGTEYRLRDSMGKGPLDVCLIFLGLHPVHLCPLPFVLYFQYTMVLNPPSDDPQNLRVTLQASGTMIKWENGDFSVFRQ